MDKKRRKHSKEFKQQVVSLILEAQQSCSEVAKAHDLAPNMLRNWVRNARENTPLANSLLSPEEHKEIVALRKQVAEQQRVIEFLKKTAVLEANQKG